MASVATIAIQTPGGNADALLACLRDRLAPDGVTVRDPDAGDVLVYDPADRDLPGLIEETLDECAKNAGLNWSDHFAVLRPDN